MEYNNIEHKGIQEIEEITPEVSTPQPLKKKMVSGTVVKQKKSLGTRLASLLFDKEDVDSIGKLLLNEVVVPAVKNTLYEAITTGVSTALFGQSGAPVSRNTYNRTSSMGRTNQYHQSYNRTNNYKRESVVDTSYRYDRGGDGRSYVPDYVFANRHEALAVLDQMRDDISMYGSVSVLSYYDYIGMESRHTDNHYGWTDLTRSGIKPTRNGFVMSLPPVETL